MKHRWTLGFLVGVSAGLILSAYQYFGPLRYVGLAAAMGLFTVNLLVGTAAGLAAALIWRGRRLHRALGG